jgi:hypothetical protein
MPIKRNTPAAAAAPSIKRGLPPATNGDGPSKEDLEGHLLVITRKDFTPDFQTSNGPSPRAVVDLLDLDTGVLHTDFWVFGVMARTISEWLESDGEMGLGRIATGTSKAGRQYWTVEWTDDDADHDRAAKSATVPF